MRRKAMTLTNQRGTGYYVKKAARDGVKEMKIGLLRARQRAASAAET